MARNRRPELYSRLDALEDRLISDLDRKVAKLNAHDMQQYNRWRHDRREWVKQQENAYAAYLSGDEGPKLPQYLERKLFPFNTITKDMPIEDIRDAYDKLKR